METKQLIRSICILFIGLVVGLIVGRSCMRSCPGKGNIIVSQVFLDSLEVIANQPPDTVIKEVIVKGETVYLDRPVPTPVQVSPDTKLYSDSIVNDSINIWDDIWVKGTIERWDRRYQPVYKEVTKEIYIPKPIPVGYEVPVPQKGFYGGLGAGYNFYNDYPMLSGEIIYLSKKGRFIGVEAIVGKDITAVMIETGIRLSR